MKSPPPGVLLTSQALCIMFEVAPLKVKDPAGGTKKVGSPSMVTVFFYADYRRG